MICPYCVEDIPDDSTSHPECKMEKALSFPLFYLDYHGGDAAEEPLTLSVVGFSGHGKTVYLAALFDFLDHDLTNIWPGFHAGVLDQESLNTLNNNRRQLRIGALPSRTKQNFPRPGIFRFSNMPHQADTTVLICDPPGEAFIEDKNVVDWASFVKRSKCTLFLIDISDLGDSAADGMATLLETYVLGMRRMGIRDKFQHLIVVYTKADLIQSSISEFREYLNHTPVLKDHLNEQSPKRLFSPAGHLKHLELISDSLYRFTSEELRAYKFINLTKTHFLSVSYTAVTGLGSSPKEGGQQLAVKMSPRCVADPLLLVLDKSTVIKPPPPAPPVQEEVTTPSWQPYLKKFGIPASIVLGLLLLIALMSKDCGGARPNTVNLLTSPEDNKSIILKAPLETKLIPTGDIFHTSNFWWLGFGKTLVKVKIENQECQIRVGAKCDDSRPMIIADLTGWISTIAEKRNPIIDKPDEVGPAPVSTDVWIRAKPCLTEGQSTPTALAMISKGTSINLMDKESCTPQGNNEGQKVTWRKISVQGKVACRICLLDDSGTWNVRIASAEGWVDKALLD